MNKKYILGLILLICILGCSNRRVTKDHASQVSFGTQAPIFLKNQREFEIYAKDVHNIYFGINESLIKDDSILKMDELISQLKKVRNIKLLLYGYTDKTGTKAYNQKLAVRRVDAVKKMLFQSGVITSNNIVIEAKTFVRDPLISHNTIDNNPKSRRVEVYIY